MYPASVKLKTASPPSKAEEHPRNNHVPACTAHERPSRAVMKSGTLQCCKFLLGPRRSVVLCRPIVGRWSEFVSWLVLLWFFESTLNSRLPSVKKLVVWCRMSEIRRGRLVNSSRARHPPTEHHSDEGRNIRRHISEMA